MILPDFILPSRVNQQLKYSGIDSLDKCADKKHFKSYPYPIEYRYNSRGFRDAEWPEDINELKNAIWCIGDSFTVGLGSPLDHTWPCVLAQHIDSLVINVSMDGASNHWMARKSIELLTTVSPKSLIIHWSYTHRREIDYLTAIKTQWQHYYYAASQNTRWPPDVPLEDFSKLSLSQQFEMEYIHGWDWRAPDDSRLLFSVNSTTDDDINRTIACINSVNAYAGDTKVIHTFIPAFVAENNYDIFFKKLAPNFDTLALNNLDFARDGHHYDIVTSKFFVDWLLPLLAD